MIELVLVYLVSIELVLVLLISIEPFVWIVLVKLVSSILEWVSLVYHIHRCALIFRLVSPQFKEKIMFVKLAGTIKGKFFG